MPSEDEFDLLTCHQSEWCYNYLVPEISWYFDINRYPSPEQQRQFISAYVGHRPAVNGQAGASPLSTSTNSNKAPPAAPAFTLDDSDTSPQNQAEAEKAAEDTHEAEVQFFMTQTRLWRVINSAQWVAWGVVQAKVPGMEEGIESVTGQSQGEDTNGHDNGTSNGHSNGHSHNGNGNHHEDSNENNGTTAQTAPADEDGFDYLAYAQDRAMMFWADMYALNLVSEGDEYELPKDMVEHIKTRILEY